MHLSVDIEWEAEIMRLKFKLNTDYCSVALILCIYNLWRWRETFCHFYMWIWKISLALCTSHQWKINHTFTLIVHSVVFAFAAVQSIQRHYLQMQSVSTSKLLKEQVVFVEFFSHSYFVRIIFTLFLSKSFIRVPMGSRTRWQSSMW